MGKKQNLINDLKEERLELLSKVNNPLIDLVRKQAKKATKSGTLLGKPEHKLLVTVTVMTYEKYDEKRYKISFPGYCKSSETLHDLEDSISILKKAGYGVDCTPAYQSDDGHDHYKISLG